ncbi:MAG: class I SAM-dependent methyltransferase [bacterium]
MQDDRIQKEKQFHDERFGKEIDLRDKVDKYYSVHKPVVDRFSTIVAKYCKNKKLLEYGCGMGSGSESWLNFGAILTGIDISEEGIKKANEWVSKTSFKAEYYVMNAEKTEFANDSFDLIVGSGIIHHLNLADSYKELNRLLNNKGHAIFIEPLGHNPIINLYRMLTPKLRTDDEHPLKVKDLKLLEDYFNIVDIEYFSFFTLFAVPFRNKSFFPLLLGVLGKIDKVIFSMPFLKRYAWTVIIHARKPK